MDFVSRERYRHRIERIAKRGKASEQAVAEQALTQAQIAHAQNPADQRRAHVGYYLVGGGINELERAMKYRPRLSELFLRAALRRPTIAYLGGLAILTLFILLPLLFYAFKSGASPTALIV